MNVENMIFAITHPIVALRVKWARDGTALSLLDEPASGYKLRDSAIILGLIYDDSGVLWPARSIDPKTGQLRPKIGDVPQHDL